MTVKNLKKMIVRMTNKSMINLKDKTINKK